MGMTKMNNLSTSNSYANKPQELQSKQYPYMLYSRGNYFGDYEIIGGPADGVYRRTSARCCQRGSVLIFLKKDLHTLTEEFPQYFDMWKVEARRRECHRLRLL